MTVQKEEISASGEVKRADNGTICGNVSGNVELQSDSSSLQIEENLSIDENRQIEHNADAKLGTTFKETELKAAIHNDKQDTNLSLAVKKPLLRRDNNPNSPDAEYKEQKESLAKSGDRFNFALKGGYSNEDAGFYTSNSLVTNLGKDCFLNLKYEAGKFKTAGEATAELNNFDFTYKDEINRPKTETDRKTRTQELNIVLNGEKNIFAANFSVDTNFNDNNNTERNYGFGGTATFNRTEYGEFNPGLNGEVQANVTQQGYKFGLDGAYNKYGNTNDFMVSSSTTLEKNNSGTNFETGLYGALRFNNCRTIIEPRSVFQYNKDSDEQVVKSYNYGLGIYQQVGKKDDTSIYLKSGRTIINGGQEKSYTEAVAGIRKKATDRLTISAETQWKTGENWSGNIGIAYRL